MDRLILKIQYEKMLLLGLWSKQNVIYLKAGTGIVRFKLSNISDGSCSVSVRLTFTSNSWQNVLEPTTYSPYIDSCIAPVIKSMCIFNTDIVTSSMPCSEMNYNFAISDAIFICRWSSAKQTLKHQYKGLVTPLFQIPCPLKHSNSYGTLPIRVYKSSSKIPFGISFIVLAQCSSTFFGVVNPVTKLMRPAVGVYSEALNVCI